MSGYLIKLPMLGQDGTLHSNEVYAVNLSSQDDALALIKRTVGETDTQMSVLTKLDDAFLADYGIEAGKMALLEVRRV